MQVIMAKKKKKASFRIFIPLLPHSESLFVFSCIVFPIYFIQAYKCLGIVINMGKHFRDTMCQIRV